MKHIPLRRAACASALVLVLAGTACGGGGGNGSDDSNLVTLNLIAFKPDRVEVSAGGSVTWRQEDVATHTVTSGRVEQAGGTATATPDGKFDSGNITKGQSFKFTFSEPGQFAFYCAVHPATMTGVVTVK